MVYITAINLVGGTGHQHIANVRWVAPGSSEGKSNSRQEMVDFLKQHPGQARVKDGIGEVAVEPIDGSPPYIRTIKDGRYTDNLLALPRY
jgi:hypothetical protein